MVDRHAVLVSIVTVPCRASGTGKAYIPLSLGYNMLHGAKLRKADGYPVLVPVVLFQVSVRCVSFSYFRRRGTEIPAAILRECGIIIKPVSLAYLRYGQVGVKQRVQNPVFLLFAQPAGYRHPERVLETGTESGV